MLYRLLYAKKAKKTPFNDSNRVSPETIPL